MRIWRIRTSIFHPIKWNKSGETTSDDDKEVYDYPTNLDPNEEHYVASDSETECDVLDKTSVGDTPAKSMLRPLQWLENELEMGNSKPIQSSSPKPNFAYQQWKDSLSKDIYTKEDKEQLLLIGEKLSSVFLDEGSGCDNSTTENSSIKNVLAFNDTVTHNRHKKSKQKSEKAPVTEKNAKKL